MRRALAAVAVAAAFLAPPAAGQPLMEGAGVAVRSSTDEERTARALEAAGKILRGDRVGELDLEQLNRALIRLETAAARDGIDAGRGREGAGEPTPGAQRSVYYLNFETGGGGANDLQVLAIQREMLENQLMVLKSLGVIADQQKGAANRAARVESGARDMTLGMRSSAAEMRKVAGDAAATMAKVNDVNRITADMAVDMKEMAKGVENIEGAIGNVESLIRETADRQEGQHDDMQRQVKRVERNVMNKLDEMENKSE